MSYSYLNYEGFNAKQEIIGYDEQALTVYGKEHFDTLLFPLVCGDKYL